MRRCLVLAMALVAVLGSCVSCRFSKVNPQATVMITGQALDASGRPLAGAPVHLFREADIGQLLLGSVVAIGTLGLICTQPGSPAPCHSAHSATTDADGNYRFEIKGSDTQGLIGNVNSLDVVVAAPGSGVTAPSTVLRFIADTTSVRLPPARLWNAAARVNQTPAQIRLGWNALSGGYGRSVSYSAELLDAHQQSLWAQSASNSSTVIDARLLEDQAGAMAAASAHATVSGGTNAGTVHASYLSARLPVRATAGAPPSRGRPCSAVTGTTTLPTTPQRVCPVTNGDLRSPARLVGAQGQVVTGVVVDLGAVRPVHLVVVRGVAGQFVIELSSDGVRFQPVDTALGSAVAFAPPGAPTARYIRVRAPSGLDESLMVQVSVW
jgi:hypothetical protein